MIRSLLARQYRRRGPAYLGWALFVEHQLGHATILLSVAILSFYIPMSLGQFVRLALLGSAFHVMYGIATVRLARRLTRPVTEWIADPDRRGDPTKAWQAAAGLPFEVLRAESVGFPLGPILWLLNLAWCMYLAWQLHLPVTSALLLYVGVMVYAMYYHALRFFGVEQVVHPVLDDVSASLPAGGTLAAPGLTLRVRLLAALPAINVITAVAAYGLARGGRARLADLPLVAVVATAVAATLSWILTLLLADSITGPITTLRKATARVREGDFDVRVPIVTTDETGELTASFNEMTAGLAERERIRSAFSTYVDADVAEHILREGTSLAGEQVEVTMMFIDVRDFTGFAERSSAPKVVATLNRLFELIVPVVHHHRGHVDKFVGDGLLAVFGAPRRQPDHAAQALAAALEIARRVEERFRGELEIGIGLNSGPVVAGNVGGAGRFEFSVIGDAVNVAARVESATRLTGDTVLIAERTKALLAGVPAVQWVERAGVPLKGRREAIALYAPQLSSRSVGGLGTSA